MNPQINAVKNIYFAAIEAGDYETARKIYYDILPRMRANAAEQKGAEFSARAKPLIEQLERLLEDGIV